MLDQQCNQLCVHLLWEFCTELADIFSTACIETSSLVSPQKKFCYDIYKLSMKNGNWLYCKDWQLWTILMMCRIQMTTVWTVSINNTNKAFHVPTFYRMKCEKYFKVHFPSFQNKWTETCHSQQNCISIHLPTLSDSATSLSRDDTVVIQSSGGWRSVWSWRYVPYVMCDGMPANKSNLVPV
jgi:hypothetical protein